MSQEHPYYYKTFYYNQQDGKRYRDGYNPPDAKCFRCEEKATNLLGVAQYNYCWFGCTPHTQEQWPTFILRKIKGKLTVSGKTI